MIYLSFTFPCLYVRPEVFECKICCVTVTAQEHLTAHLNGARHKLQVRKIDANENYSGKNVIETSFFFTV